MLSNQLEVFLRLLLQIQMILRKQVIKRREQKLNTRGEVKKETWLRCSAFRVTRNSLLYKEAHPSDLSVLPSTSVSTTV